MQICKWFKQPKKSFRIHVTISLIYAKKLHLIKEKTIYQIRQPIAQKVFHHHVTCYVQTTNWFTHSSCLTNPSMLHNHKQLHSVKKSYCIIKNHFKPEIEQYLKQQHLEEHNYYKYHPSVARKLARSYLQELFLMRNVHGVDSSFHKRDTIWRRQLLLQKSTISLWKPLIQEHTTRLTYHQLHQNNESIPKEETHSHVEATKEIMIERLEMKQIIQEVYHEIEKKWRQEQQRRGRRSS